MNPGEVFEVELQGRGHEQRDRRPVIVVQAVGVGFPSTRLCVPTSTSAHPFDWRVQIEVAGELTVALVEQTRVVDVTTMGPLVARFSRDDLRDVLARLRDLLPWVSPP